MQTTLRLSHFITAFSLSCAAARGQQLPNINSNTVSQIQAIKNFRTLETPEQQKISPDLLAQYQVASGVHVSGLPSPTTTTPANAKTIVVVDLIGSPTPQLKKIIIQNGGTIIAEPPINNYYVAAVPSKNLVEVAKSPDLTFMRPYAGLMVHRIPRISRHPSAHTTGLTKGLQDTEGEIAHDVATARALYKVNGTGIRIGVLSDSIRHLTAAQNAGSIDFVKILPNQDGVLPANSPLKQDTGEGTALLGSCL